MTDRIACVGLILLLVLSAATAHAERAPLSPAKLTEQASHVFVGRVVRVDVHRERSRTERGWGNFDDVFDLTIAVDTVEKGAGVQAGEEVVVRAFRSRRRKSTVETIGWGGHDAIPGRDTAVRVHVIRDGPVFDAIYPNGIADPAGAPLRDGPEVTGTFRYTFLLPLETWVLLGACAVVVLIIGMVVRVRRRRRSTGGSPPSD